MKRFFGYAVLLLISVMIGLVASAKYFGRSEQTTDTTDFVEIKTTSASNKPAVAVTPQPSYSFDSPPAKTFIGKITSQSGDIQWLSRSATEAAVLTADKLLQGEEVTTGKTGRMQLEFVDVLRVSVNPNTYLTLIQALPSNIVFEQKSGSVGYEKIGTVSVAIRSFHLLTQIESGSILLAIDELKPIITISVLQGGKVTLGFNDSERITTVQKLEAGDIATFNEETRKLTIEKATLKTL